METPVSIQIAEGREKTKSAGQRVTRARRIAPLRSNLLGYNAVISYPAKRAAAPLFRNTQPKGPQPLSKPKLRTAFALVPDRFQDGL
jgi:hypothetical protein